MRALPWTSGTSRQTSLKRPGCMSWWLCSDGYHIEDDWSEKPRASWASNNTIPKCWRCPCDACDDAFMPVLGPQHFESQVVWISWYVLQPLILWLADVWLENELFFCICLSVLHVFFQKMVECLGHFAILPQWVWQVITQVFGTYGTATHPHCWGTAVRCGWSIWCKVKSIKTSRVVLRQHVDSSMPLWDKQILFSSFLNCRKPDIPQWNVPLQSTDLSPKLMNIGLDCGQPWSTSCRCIFNAFVSYFQRNVSVPISFSRPVAWGDECPHHGRQGQEWSKLRLRGVRQSQTEQKRASQIANEPWTNTNTC